MFFDLDTFGASSTSVTEAGESGASEFTKAFADGLSTGEFVADGLVADGLGDSDGDGDGDAAGAFSDGWRA